MILDIDSTGHEQHGEKMEGLAYNYKKEWGLDSIEVFDQKGFLYYLNVDRRFDELASAHNRLWVSDLTYIWTQQGWLYLCVFLDVYSRKVVGYSIDDTMEAAMVNDALKMAFRRRTVDKGLLIHSDQGARYASGDFEPQGRLLG